MDNMKNMRNGKIDVTFVIPGRNNSGGVRVTVEMANRLLNRGYITRIIYPEKKEFLKIKLRKIYYALMRFKNTDWVKYYQGPIEPYTDINNISFRKNEIVIAVGLYSVEDVLKIKTPVIKVRYNHGFTVGKNDMTNIFWGPQDIHTITVSHTLVDRLEMISKQKVDAVIPNGVNENEYFVEECFGRCGIGMMYSNHPNKAGEDMITLCNEIQNIWPKLKIYMFGVGPKPRHLKNIYYKRYPSIREARKIYNKCIIWISTSREEGLPGPILEAMACGCIVISADNLGATEIIEDSKNGYLVPVGSVNKYIEKIKEVLCDKNIRDRLQKEGLKTVKNYSWEIAVEKMDRYLKQLNNGSS